LLWLQMEFSHDLVNLFLIHQNAILVTHPHHHPTIPVGLLGSVNPIANQPIHR